MFIFWLRATPRYIIRGYQVKRSLKNLAIIVIHGNVTSQVFFLVVEKPKH